MPHEPDNTRLNYRDHDLRTVQDALNEEALNKQRATIAVLVNALDALNEDNADHNHVETDRLMTAWFVENGFPEVADARKQVQVRCGSFYYA